MLPMLRVQEQKSTTFASALAVKATIHICGVEKFTCSLPMLCRSTRAIPHQDVTTESYLSQDIKVARFLLVMSTSRDNPQNN